MPHSLQTTKEITTEELPPLYDLCGVVYHYGSFSGGHYTSACLNSESKIWYAYNDSVVTEIDEKSLVTQYAYILLYKQKQINYPVARKEFKHPLDILGSNELVWEITHEGWKET